VLDGKVSDVKRGRGSEGARRVALAVGSSDGSGGSAALSAALGDRALVSRVDDQNRFFELELAPGASPHELLRRLVEGGVDIARFELVQPSLHQIFLDRVGATGVEPGMSGHG
jgi:ABC-2 type transport system ATP-binding protein